VVLFSVILTSVLIIASDKSKKLSGFYSAFFGEKFKKSQNENETS